MDIRCLQSARPARSISGASICAQAAPIWNWGIECACVPPLGVQLSGWIFPFTMKEVCVWCRVWFWCTCMSAGALTIRVHIEALPCLCLSQWCLRYCLESMNFCWGYLRCVGEEITSRVKLLTFPPPSPQFSTGNSAFLFRWNSAQKLHFSTKTPPV